MPSVVANAGTPKSNAAPKAKACFKCGQQGHLGKECTAPPKSGAKAPAPAAAKTDGPVAAGQDKAAADKKAEAAQAEAAKKAEAAKAAADKKAEEDRLAADKKAAEEAAAAELANLKNEIMEKKDDVVKRINTLTGAALDAEIQNVRRFAADPKDPQIRLACNEIWTGVIATMTPATEPATVKLIPEFLASTTDRDAKVRAVASDNMLTLCSKVCHHGVTYALPLLLASMAAHEKWQIKTIALRALEALALRSPAELKQAIPVIMPVMHEVLFDTKPEVVAAADATLKTLFKEMVSNKDLEPFLPALMSSINHLEEVPECIQQLASTTFVQTVDSASLSVIVPLMIRGFRQDREVIHRQCAKIITNMVQLVDEPHEAAPFLDSLTPAMDAKAKVTSDPEARGVLERGVKQLRKLKEQVDALPKELTHERVLGQITAALNGKGTENQLNYLAMLGRSLVLCKDVDSFNKEVAPFVKATGATAEEVAAVLTAIVTFQKEQAGEIDDGIPAHLKLCDTTFTLAYGSKVLLHNTKLKLIRGHKYGLLGGNDSGKTTLMRALANHQVDGFPTDVRTVFVEADIQGELSHLNNVDYIFQDPRIQKLNIERKEVQDILLSVGFTEKMLVDSVSTLSGGWRMKLALSRAMLQKADVLLLDEPTNHLDVINVAWVQGYLNSVGLKETTCLIVSHDKSMLDNCCTDILVIQNLRLASFPGNLSNYVKDHPEAKSFFELKAEKFRFTFPQPTSIQGIKSRGRPLIKMDDVTFTYPGNTKPTLFNVTIRASMASRVGCVGVNGAGKSTMIKLLTGELVADPNVGAGVQWKHDACRVAYVAQHAFHHIEQHLTRTPNEYIRWRYEGGEDKESLNKATLVLTDEDLKLLATPVLRDYVDQKGTTQKVKRTFDRLTGARRPVRKEFEYEVVWQGMTLDQTEWLTGMQLSKMGADKHTKYIDIKVEAAAGAYTRALTSAQVEKHLEDIGLEKEFASHYRMSALSGGQKVKVVLAAAMWMQPHILILDEPTNYLDRDSLGALANAIDEFEGGVVIISHNDQFVSTVCKEHWVMEAGRLDVKGDAEWMKNQDTEIEFKAIETTTDAAGNTVKVKQPKGKMSRQEKKTYDKLKKAARARGEEVSSDEE